MRVGIIGTGAISHKHAQAYKNIGYQVTVCTDISEAYGKKFAEQYGCEFVPTYRRTLQASERGLCGCVHVPRFPAAAAEDLR